MHLRLHYDKRLRKLFHKNFVIFSIVIFVMIMLLVLPFSFHLSNLYKNQLLEINNDLLNRSKDMCDSIISEVQMYTISASINDDIIAFAASKEEENHVVDVQNHLRFYKYINNYIDSICIFNSGTGNLITDTSIIRNDEALGMIEYDKSQINKENPTLISICAKNNKYPFVIRVVRQVEIGDNTIAIIADIDIDKFNDLFENIDSTYTNQLFITTKVGNIVHGDKLKEQFNLPINQIVKSTKGNYTKINDKLFLVSEKNSEKFDLRYLSLMPIEYYTATTSSYMVVIIISTILSLIMGMIMSLLMARRSLSHIELILSEIGRDDKKDNKSRKIPLEIRCIIDDIRNSVKKTENIEGEISGRILLLKLAQVQALQSQINPHFLHNTLDSINWMAFSKMGKNNEVSKCITELSEMFRLGLQTDAYIIPFREELEHAEVYCRLLKIRYNEKVDIKFNVSEDVLNINTVKFILQPIIENAVYHGIKPKEGDGNIWVNAFLENGDLYIQIKDDGVGIGSVDLAKINKELEYGFGTLDDQIVQIVEKWESYGTETKDNFKKKSWWLGRQRIDVGIGIKNVNNRIKMIFGENYGLKLMKNEAGGITVEIRMPIKEI